MTLILRLTLTSWIIVNGDDVTLWLPMEFGEIYAYLIDTPGPFTRKKMKAYESIGFQLHVLYQGRFS